MKKVIKICLITILSLLLLIGVGFYGWAQFYYDATEEALSLVNKKDENYFVFGDQFAKTGIIFYQGAKVEAQAYSYIGDELAQEGYFVVIPQMPLNLALFGINEARHIMNQYNEIENWYVGGHSMGGAMVSRFAYQNDELVSGVIFLASYPADDFSDTAMPMLSIYGELDGLATVEKMAEKQELLSEHATLAMIEGGNHANFGMYGPQKGDNDALITQEEQRERTIQTITQWLNE